MLRETGYQFNLIRRLQNMFPGCFILRNDSASMQGVPDILILFGNKWAMLECKKSSLAHVQPNQRYYVEMFNEMSFAAFIFPENEEQVLNDLQHAFNTDG